MVNITKSSLRTFYSYSKHNALNNVKIINQNNLNCFKECIKHPEIFKINIQYGLKHDIIELIDGKYLLKDKYNDIIILKEQLKKIKFKSLKL